MKANTKKAAWEIADEIIESDYELNDLYSANAGYPVWTSTRPGYNAWISDLGDRLEINLPAGESVNVWIEPETEPETETETETEPETETLKPHFLVYIDYKATSSAPNGEGYEYRLLKSKNLLDAIAETEKMRNNGVYLVRIMQEIGSPRYIRREGYLHQYKAVLCARSFGWHLNNLENGESDHITAGFTEGKYHGILRDGCNREICRI